MDGRFTDEELVIAKSVDLCAVAESLGYAFHLEIDTSEVLPASFKLFDINKIGFAIWNTERPKIISQMNLYKPEDLLA